jgi:hypothetical protein
MAPKKRRSHWRGRLARLDREVRDSPVTNASGAALLAGGLAAFSGLSRRRSAAVAAAAFAQHRRQTLMARSLARQARNAGDVAAFAGLVPEAVLLFGDFAIDTDFARALVWELRGEPETIVEFGSGLSTVITAKHLEAAGKGRVYSVEANELYADGTRRLLESAGLADRVELVVAPLREQRIGSRDVLWHDLDRLAGLRGLGIDLLVVDGPPTSRHFAWWSRWAAVEVLHPNLLAESVILLDDGRRAPERSIAYQWARDHTDLELYWIDTVKGAWRLTKRPTEREPGVSAALHRLGRLVNPMPSNFGLIPIRRW